MAAARRAVVRKTVRKAPVAAFKAAKRLKADLKACRRALHAELTYVNSQLGRLEAELAGAAVRQSLGRTPASGRRRFPGRKGLRDSHPRWIAALLEKEGPLQTGEILQRGRRAGRNVRAMAFTLSAMSRAGRLKTSKPESGRGRIYRLP